MKKIVITGQSGLIGKHLTKLLQGKGYEVCGLSRTQRGENQFFWDIAKMQLDANALKDASVIIHLAGAGIAEKRWSEARKKDIIESRVKSAELLYQSVKNESIQLEAFISASGINYYGTTTSAAIFTETDGPGNDFAAKCCVAWEEAVDKFAEITRVVKLRTGVVLAKNGGALKKMIPPVKMGIGSPLGTGRQYVPWIHIDDVCQMYLWAIENTNVTGAYNAISPEHTTNKELMHQIAKALKKPFFFPAVPAFVIKLLFGKMGNLVLEGSRASADKVLREGFVFRFPELSKALACAVSK
ncbi:MAG: TIGR01777 family oxidoreductase [Flavobacteriales bacterium]